MKDSRLMWAMAASQVHTQVLAHYYSLQSFQLEIVNSQLNWPMMPSVLVDLLTPLAKPI